MAKQITTWRPDTCGCEIEYEWDDTTAETNRVHTIKNINKVCDAHVGLTKKLHFDSVIEENQRKNKILTILVDNFPALTEQVAGDDGKSVTKLKNDLAYKWTFDINRNLEVEVVGMPIVNKTPLQSLCDTTFGQGKVKVK